MTPAAATKAKKPGVAGNVSSKATKQLATITESSDGESEPLLSKKAQILSRRGMIMEDTDSDGVNLLLRYWKLKAREEMEGSDAVESDMDVPSLKLQRRMLMQRKK